MLKECCQIQSEFILVQNELIKLSKKNPIEFYHQFPSMLQKMIVLTQRAQEIVKYPVDLPSFAPLHKIPFKTIQKLLTMNLVLEIITKSQFC